MQNLDPGIAEKLQQEVAAAGLAEARIHRLLVDHRSLAAGQAGTAEGRREFLLQLVHAFGRRGGEEREDLVEIDGAGDMPGRIGVGIARVDDDTRF
jgi:hypothetical protein